MRNALKVSTTKEDQQHWREEIAKHEKMFKAERDLNPRKEAVGAKLPNEFMSMIVDGADQSQFNLPHFTRQTKSVKGKFLISLQLLGQSSFFFVHAIRYIL